MLHRPLAGLDDEEARLLSSAGDAVLADAERGESGLTFERPYAGWKARPPADGLACCGGTANRLPGAPEMFRPEQGILELIGQGVRCELACN